MNYWREKHWGAVLYDNSEQPMPLAVVRRYDRGYTAEYWMGDRIGGTFSTEGEARTAAEAAVEEAA